MNSIYKFFLCCATYTTARKAVILNYKYSNKVDIKKKSAVLYFTFASTPYLLPHYIIIDSMRILKLHDSSRDNNSTSFVDLLLE